MNVVDIFTNRHWHISVGLFGMLIVTQIGTICAQYGQAAGAWKIAYTDNITEKVLDATSHMQYINLTIYDVDLTTATDFFMEVHIAATRLVTADKRIDKHEFVDGTASSDTLATWHGAVPVRGHHYGYTQLFVLLTPSVGMVERSQQSLNITVTHGDRVDNNIFTYTASALVLLMFLNLGTVLDLQRLKAIALRPIGPAIGFCTSYLLMPSLALGLGFLFLPGQRELQLALFYTALAPSGGLANICNVFLRGNVNLAIATTTVNSLLALAMFPLWFLMTARVIYDDSSLSVPFGNLAVSSVALIAAVSVGLALRLLVPKTTRFISRFLKPFSVFLSLCLIAVTVGINAFAFKELTLMISLAALSLPIVGYLVAFGISKLFKLTNTDALTIAIETSVLNMTVPIILLESSLDNPQVDMAIVMPMIAALFSLILVTIFYIVRRLCGWDGKKEPEAFDSEVFLVEYEIYKINLHKTSTVKARYLY